MRLERLYQPEPDARHRVAVVAVEPARGPAGQSEHQQFLIRVGRGENRSRMTDGDVYGPLDASHVDREFDLLVEGLRKEGFVPAGWSDTVDQLRASDSAARARAALRLGWEQRVDAVGRLVDMLDGAVDDLCSVIDALGLMGDAQAIDAIRPFAARKLLSRRRSAVEALRQLGDAVGLADAHARALADLTPALANAVEANHTDPRPILTALEQAPSKRLGYHLDLLYEIATPASVEAVRQRLQSLLYAQPFVWRYVKSIYKRSMLRHDFAMHGWLACHIERQAHVAKRIRAKVKSGYDGETREVSLFSRRTANHLRRLSWRYLRKLARYRPAWYADAAASAVSAYRADDMDAPAGLRGQFGRRYLLHQVLFGASQRFELNEGRLEFLFRSSAHVKAPPGVREEAFPELWDQQPLAYLSILAGTHMPLAIQFASRAISERHPGLIQHAKWHTLTAMMCSSLHDVIDMARVELKRRFDPDSPNFDAMEQLLDSEPAAAHNLGLEWLEESVALWAQEGPRLRRYLASDDGEVLSTAIRSLSHLHDRADEEQQRRLGHELASELLPVIRQPVEIMEGVSAVACSLALDGLAARVSLAESLSWLESDNPAVVAIGATMLPKMDRAAASIGTLRLEKLANHSLFVVRSMALTLLRERAEDWASEPSLWFRLVDSAWEDTRKAAMDVLRALRDWSAAPAGQLVGFADSAHADVRAFAMDCIRHMSQLESQLESQAGKSGAGALPSDGAASSNLIAVIDRLLEHPEPVMQRFALELAETHFDSDADAMKKLLPCIQSTLLDTWPSRRSKKRAVDLLLRHATVERQQAAAAVSCLDQWVRTAGVHDRAEALAALAAIQLQYPGLQSSVAAIAAVAVEEPNGLGDAR